MTIRALPPSEWPRFLEEFSRDHRAWLTSIELSRVGDVAPERLERPLVAVAATTEHGRTTTVDIVLHPREDPHNTIHVAAPRAVRVHETDEGAAQHVEIEGRDGNSVFLRFRGVPPRDVLLDGMAPGELS